MANSEVSTPDLDGASSNLDPKNKSISKVRRRNRMITSCLECRRRKLKCDKLHPCTNCNKFSRECMFLGPALDSVSQQKLNEIKEKMGSLEKVLEQDVARRGSVSKGTKKERKSSVDLPGEESSSDDEAQVPEDEKGLEPTPLAVVDGSYEDDADDDVLDLGIRIGKMRMTERLGGFFRPKMTEELSYTLATPQSDARTIDEKLAPNPQLENDAQDFLEPGPSYIAPGAGFIFGDVGNRRNLIDFLPTKGVADILVTKYYENCHFLARVLHWPSFRIQHENFWTSVLAGIEPPASQQAVVLSVMFCAIASMPDAEVVSIFGQQKRIILVNFQKGTELALSKAQFLRATRIETLQALVIYLIPMCRDQMSRAHSVLVGTAIRLAECMGLHRDPADTYGLPAIECQVRRMLWFQLCFLDFRTGEVQGPRPCIKREDYDTRFPLNIDDSDLMSGKVEESTSRWTDMTLSRIRCECSEMHRIIWYDRIRLEKKKVSLTHVLGKLESFRKAMDAKYAPILDHSVPIQKYAYLMMQVLLYRMHIMVLHRYHNHWASGVPDRLRQIILSSGTAQVEAAMELEKRPDLSRWKWYNGSHQQWHTAFLLLVEIFKFPNRREADRIWKVIDFVFEPDLSLSRTQKARSILIAIKDRTAVYRDLRRIRAPVSMRTDEVLKWRGKSMQINDDFNSGIRKSTSPMLSDRLNVPNGSSTMQSESIDAIARTAEGLDNSWTVDRPASFYIAPYRNDWNSPHPQSQQQTASNTQTPPAPPLVPDFSSPSESSNVQESWPPMITNNQGSWQMLHAPSVPNSVPVTMTDGVFQTASPLANVAAQRGSNGHQNSTMGIGTGMNGNPTPIIPGAMMISTDDSLMLDIDWNEWDKIFPPDQNTGNLDVSPQPAQPGQHTGQQSGILS